MGADPRPDQTRSCVAGLLACPVQWHARMGAIHNLLERLGYVKLGRYGLLLTPDGRILSQRPAVLDDGGGNKIVGWQESDLAAMELEKWEPPRPARKKATAIRVAVATAPTIPAPARPMLPQVAAVVAPAVKLPGLVAPVAPPPVVAAPTVPAPVDAAEEAGDDDWEWTIAVARARAAAEEAEQAAAQPKFVKPPFHAEPTRTEPAFKAEPTVETSAPRPVKPVAKPVASAPIAKPTVSNFFQDAPKTQPMAKVAEPAPLPPPPAVQAKRPGTEDGEDWEKMIAKARVAATPKTIIPVPQLPRVADPSLVRPPVVAPLKRVPRATHRVEDTVRTHAAPPANDDRTQPGIALPPSGGGRRVAAKQK
jgi:hypothetical protein